ncbi:MAG: cation-transporting P-type ATPase [Gammaproteobacteria bacterium]
MAIRDGVTRKIAALELVPGDAVIVKTGELFPADGLVLKGEGLQAEESALTGESFPVRKTPLATALAADSEAGVDVAHWGFAGTRLLTGSALLRIVNTGGTTWYGDIVRSALHGAHARTPMQQAIANLVAVLLVATVVLCAILAWVRLRQGYGVIDALVSAATLAVAAIPEEFPVVFTFFLGVGIFRLAKRQALVRRAVVVENIGRVTAICCDKTGTMTEGRLRLTHELAAAGVSDAHLLTVAALASRLQSGDPLDLAILAKTPEATRTEERLATYPFTEDRRRESAVFRVHPGGLWAVVKGAPETVFALCSLTAAERTHWEQKIRALATSGHKVIACAWRELDEAGWPGGEPDRDYRCAGLLACEDPVREGAAVAVRAALGAGIRVIMVTGDHADTASAVARTLGIGGGSPKLIEGSEIDVLLDHSDNTALGAVDVVARATPAHKLRLVRALQGRGEIVAVTGDGVNDVPALQAADIGIAMGERGTRSAREAGAIVLLDDNFRTLMNAIAEGRQLFHNLRLSFTYLLMIHIPLVVTAALIPLAGFPLLYLPVHIVWLELIIHPTALFVFQDLPPAGPLRPRKHRDRVRFFSGREWWLIGLVGAFITLAITFGYQRSLGVGHDIDHARSIALAALIVASAATSAGLSGLRSWPAWLTVLASLASLALLIQLPPLAAALHLTPLHGDDGLLALATGALTLLLARAARPATER